MVLRQRDGGGHKEWAPSHSIESVQCVKAMQEDMAIAWWRCYDVPLIITNTMNNFGEMQASSKFPAMIQKHIEYGEIIRVHSAKSGEIGTRYYIHSRNTADALLFILKAVPVVLHTAGRLTCQCV